MRYCGLFSPAKQYHHPVDSKATLQSCDLHALHVQRAGLPAQGFVMRVRHLLVVLLIELANADTAQKVHYQANTDNRSDYHCITRNRRL